MRRCDTCDATEPISGQLFQYTHMGEITGNSSRCVTSVIPDGNEETANVR